jgi:hypothetical protein
LATGDCCSRCNSYKERAALPGAACRRGKPGTSVNLSRRKSRGEKSLALKKRHAKKIQFAARTFVGHIPLQGRRALCIGRYGLLRFVFGFRALLGGPSATTTAQVLR